MSPESLSIVLVIHVPSPEGPCCKLDGVFGRLCPLPEIPALVPRIPIISYLAVPVSQYYVRKAKKSTENLTVQPVRNDDASSTEEAAATEKLQSG